MLFICEAPHCRKRATKKTSWAGMDDWNVCGDHGEGEA